LAGQLIHPRDQLRSFVEGRSAERALGQIRAEELEAQPELQVQLVLPLLYEPARRHDQAPTHVLSQHQLLDVEPSHDRLAGARVISEQEALGLIGSMQHSLAECAVRCALYGQGSECDLSRSTHCSLKASD
jgi:hypothetical protein